MDSGDGERVMTAVSTALAWFGLDSLSGLITESREGVFMASGVARKLKIILFPVNIDKFTGFFDKFLKGAFLVIGCNHIGYQ